MICNSCGAEMAEGAKFCPKCGAATEFYPQTGETETIVVDEKTEIYDRKKKKTVVILAIIACILTVLGSGLQFFANFLSDTATMNPAPDFFVRYLEANLADILTEFVVPVIISVLFIVFCSIVNIRSNLRKALIGIPMILTVADRIIAFTVSCVIISRNAAQYANSSIIAMNIGYFVRASSVIAALTFFVILYILSSSNKFTRTKTGRILTLIFGIWAELLSFVSMLAAIISAAGRPQNIYGLYKIPAIFAYLFSFSAEVLTVMAMIICIFWFASRAGAKNYGEDSPSFGYAILGFFIPLAGLIIYIVNYKKTPAKAKSAGYGALVGVISNIVAYILVSAMIIAFLSAL